MKEFPTVIGHSGLDVTGDAERSDIKDTSVKVFLEKIKTLRIGLFLILVCWLMLVSLNKQLLEPEQYQ